MTTPDTPLGLRKIDPETDQHRLAYQWINDNADTTTELIQADRLRLTAVEDGLDTLDPNAVKPAFGKYGLTVGDVRVKPGIDSRYSAFPGVTVLADGRLYLVWREGADHISTRDGVIMSSISEDNGLTWASASIAFQDETPGIDLRDPSASTSADRQTLYVTYLKGSAALNAAGFFLRISTDQGESFGPEIRIDPHPYSAGTSPVVELSNGLLLATWYGKENLSDTRDSCYYATSADGGQTWGAPVKFVDGVVNGTDMQEPWASVYKDTVVIMFRWGNTDRVGIIRSTNGGASWNTPAPAFSGGGRPSNIFTSNGTLVVTYRNAVTGPTTSQHGMVRYSYDAGVTWATPRLLERANPQWWNYSALTEVSRGVIFVPTAVEGSPNTVSKLSMRYIIEGGGVSPYGDVTPSPYERALLKPATIAVVDSFDRPDGPLGQTENGIDWASYSTGHSIVDGALTDASNNGITISYVSALCYEYEIEAEFLWNTNAGLYIIFRLQNSTNYLMFGLEANGTAARLYKVVNGTATQLGTSAVGVPAGAFHKLRVSVVGSNIRCYVEDVAVISVTDTTGATMPYVGIRTGIVGTTYTHKARNYVVRRRNSTGLV